MSRINTNIGALNALRSLTDVGNKLLVSQSRLSTGRRINNAADDAAGFSIAKKFNVRSHGLGQALNNIGTAKNLISVTEGHLNNIVDILTQMKVKTTQGIDGSLGVAERSAINAEIMALIRQIDLEVTQATWNGKDILTETKTSGDSSALFNFQIGAGSSSANDVLMFDLFKSSNVNFTASNVGYTSAKLQLDSTANTSSTSQAAIIKTTESFADAGFTNVPDGTVTINGSTFTLANYSTVQDFIDAVNNDVTANVTISYNSSQDRFSLVQDSGGEDLVLSQTGTNGFFTQAKITTGTYPASPASTSSTSQVVSGTGNIDVSESFADAGFTNIPDGTVTINGSTFTLADYSTVQNFIDAVNNDVTADVTISYNSSTDKFTIVRDTTGAGENLVFSETGTYGFFTEVNIPPATYTPPTKSASTSTNVATIDVTKNFVDAHFDNPPDGKVTINGKTFDLGDYSTVQEFMDAVNNEPEAEATLSYDSSTDRFTIENKNLMTDLVISESPDTAGYGFFTQAKISEGTYSQNYLDKINNAFDTATSALSYLGAVQNRLTYQENSLTTSRTNTDAARSRIEDADMAEEQVNATKLQILQQTSSAMLAQANISPQTIMNLFK